jgi:hypothetical protein
MIFSNSAPVATPRCTFRPARRSPRPSAPPRPAAERITTYELGYLAELRPLASTSTPACSSSSPRPHRDEPRELHRRPAAPQQHALLRQQRRADIRGLEIAATWRPGTDTWLSAHTELRIDGPGIPPPRPRAPPAAGSGTPRPGTAPHSSAPGSSTRAGRSAPPRPGSAR